MNFLEYGRSGASVIVMLHGGGLSWWNYQREAELLQDQFHVVLPILDGHAESDAHFHSISKNASDICAYLRSSFETPIAALCGLSLGAQVAIEMIGQDPEICGNAVFESPSLIPSPMMNYLIPASVSMSYPLISKKWFSRLQFTSLKMNEHYFESYYRDSCKISRDDLTFLLKASCAYSLPENLSSFRGNVRIHVGAKERKNMLRSAGLLHAALPQSTLTIHEGLSHGEYSLNHPDRYVSDLLQILS